MVDVLGVLQAVPLIGIVRKWPAASAGPTAAVLADAGLRVVEVTLDSERALDQVAAMQAEAPSLTVGVGSVLTAAQVKDAASAGATFIVSPNTDSDVIAAAVAADLPIFPGAATATEIRAALLAGATAAKVFPASLLGGPAFLDAVRSPLGNPPLVPTGGIGLDDVRAYLDRGAIAVGVGGSLFPSVAAGASPDLERLATETRRWVAAASAAQ